MGAHKFGINTVFFKKTAFIGILRVKPDTLGLERSVLAHETLYDAVPLAPTLCTKAFAHCRAYVAALHTFAAGCKPDPPVKF